MRKMRGMATLTLSLCIGASAIAMPSSAHAVEKTGKISLANDAGTTILNGSRETIWYKSASSGYSDFNQKTQATTQSYAGFYQVSGDSYWYRGTAGWSKTLYANTTNSPWRVHISNVAATTPMVVGGRDFYGGNVTMVH